MSKTGAVIIKALDNPESWEVQNEGMSLRHKPSQVKIDLRGYHPSIHGSSVEFGIFESHTIKRKAAKIIDELMATSILTAKLKNEPKEDPPTDDFAGYVGVAQMKKLLASSVAETMDAQIYKAISDE